jgi:hypothetical protein
MLDRFNAACAAAWISILVLLATSGCSDNGLEPADTTPPSAVADLVAGDPTSSSVVLRWTAPKDKGNTGAAQYDIRYATWPITESNWSLSPQAAGEPKPRSAGRADTLLIKDLLPDTRYYFGLKSADAEPNWSALSNVADAKTEESPDTIPPSAVANLAAGSPTAHSMTLMWTAPGDDENTGTATQYDIRYSTTPIDDVSWISASQAAGVPAPKTAGTPETFVADGLAPDSTYYFALKTADDNSNWSALSNVASGSTLNGTWSALGLGMHGDVYALAVYGGRLIAAGNFTTAGEVNVNYIAAWDGVAWSALGSGTNGNVFALTVYDGKLIAAGNFTIAGEVAANRIAAWDGAAWSALGSGMNNPVDALTVHDGDLIAGGAFTTAGEGSAGCIAAWDGDSWSPLSSGMSGGYIVRVLALASYNDRLIAGGAFTTAGGNAANCIAAWDGTFWAPLGLGMNIGVGALAVLNNKLIAGGPFTTAGGANANYVAAWDGSSWAPLGSGMDGPVRALTVYYGQIAAGGFFTAAGGGSANYIALWDNAEWSPLGPGVNHSPPSASAVYALTTYEGRLIAGGWFTTAGEVAARSIAAWK